MNRRAILGLIGGGALSGPSIGRGAVRGLMGQSVGLASVGSGALTASDECPVACESGPPSYLVHDAIFAARRQAQNDMAHGVMPPAILTKRSWSPAFKAHCIEEQIRFERAVEKRLQKDRAFRERMAQMLGVAE